MTFRNKFQSHHVVNYYAMDVCDLFSYFPDGWTEISGVFSYAIGVSKPTCYGICNVWLNCEITRWPLSKEQHYASTFGVAVAVFNMVIFIWCRAKNDEQAVFTQECVVVERNCHDQMWIYI